jgi:hypothetical protein
MAQSPWSKQISNRNYLSPVGFKFILSEYPKVDFFSNSSQIPGINLGVAIQPNYLKDIPIPGDKLSYDDFSFEFFVDENLQNYLQVHNWMRGLGLIIYNSNYNPISQVNFRGLFPVSLSTIDFNAKAQDINYVTANVTFKYTLYDIVVY